MDVSCNDSGPVLKRLLLRTMGLHHVTVDDSMVDDSVVRQDPEGCPSLELGKRESFPILNNSISFPEKNRDSPDPK